jgi:isopenicillin N synthase-like dioxygenase
MSELPIIDFSPFLNPYSSIETKRTTALQIDQACRDVGFFYLSNHAINESLMEEVLLNAKRFFENATEEERRRIAIKKVGDGGGDGARGWMRHDKVNMENYEVSPSPAAYSLKPNASSASTFTGRLRTKVRLTNSD